MTEFDFVPVKLRALPVDVLLDCKIYFEKPIDSPEPGGLENELILLCENQTITQELLSRLKRAIFPKSKVFIPLEYAISTLFANGHFLGFTDKEVQDIKSGKLPWVKEGSAFSAPPPPRKKIEKVKPLSGVEVFKDKVYKLEKVVNQYNESKESTHEMLKTVVESGKVNTDKSSLIVSDIQSQISASDSSMILYAINQVRNVDEYLYTHSLNVAYLNGLVGKWLKFTPEQQSDLVSIGLFHDLGKLRINPDILNKPAKLTDEEFNEIKRHPVLSMETLIKSGIRNKIILEGVIQHHEKVNGSGYPKGLDSNGISEFARVTAISDIYDAMVTKRVYKEPVSPFVILNDFMKTGYSELDIKYINIFVNCVINELKGKVIIMNDGSEAIIRMVNPRKVLHPMVEINGDVVATDDTLYCVRMKDVLNK
jgi:HD-GYP domain-containing protein (c-di-GMP phosphodiesterase class II)